MRSTLVYHGIGALLMTSTLAAQSAAPDWQGTRDPSPHTARFIAVDKDVKLEVLDWGGTGRPIVLLAGLGNTGHVFDQFATTLTLDHHVYAITRRGFGASSAPAAGYGADRLGDDVLAVLDSLGLEQPVLVGHSIAGEELSSIGSRHPDRVAGLVYLDAGYAYAYYDHSRGDLAIDFADVQRKLDQVKAATAAQPTANGVQALKAVLQELLDTSLPSFEKNLREFQRSLETTPLPSVNGPTPPPPPFAAAAQAVMAGGQKYTAIRAPALAIFALPHQFPPGSAADAGHAAAQAADSARTAAQAAAFERGVPSARVIRIPNANHYVFFSHENDVVREIRAFIQDLP